MKEVSKYPHLAVYTPDQPMYPNAADHRYFAQRAVNIITSIVSGMGFICAMLFLLTMN